MGNKLYKEEYIKDIADSIRDNYGLEGYNLFDKKNMQFVNASNSDFDITTHSSPTRVRTNTIEFPYPNKTFTMSGLTDNVYLVAIREFDKDKNYLQQNTVTNNTFTLKENTNYIHYVFRNIANTNLDKDLVKNMDICLVEGTEPKPYEPHELKYKVSEMDQGITDVANKILELVPKNTSVGTNTLLYDKAKPYNVLDSKIRGNVEQETTTGANLINAIFENIYKGVMQRCTATKIENGVRLVGKNEGGYAYVSFKINDDILSTMLGKNINIKAKTIGSSTPVMKLYYIKNNNLSTQFGNEVLAGNKNNIVIFPDSLGTNEGMALVIYIDDKTTTHSTSDYAEFSNIIMSFDDVQYEPFTNGASPNPNYPQEINTLKSYQLVDLRKLGTYTQNGITSTYSADGTISISGTATGSYAYISPYIEQNLDDKDYTVNAITEYPRAVTFRTFVDTSTTSTSYQMSTTNNYQVRQKNNDKTNYYRLLISTVKDETYNFTIKIIVSEKDSTNNYLPFGNIAKRHIGKNIYNENSQYNINASIGGNSGLQFPASTGGNRRTYFMKVKPNTTYTVSTSTSFDRLQICFNTSIFNPMAYYNVGASKAKILDERNKNLSNVNGTTFTTKEDTKMVAIYYALDVLPENVQIEENDHATEYEPYKEEIQYIDLDNNEVLTDDEIQIDRLGNAKLIKKWGKIVLDGSESGWTKNDIPTGGIRAYLQLTTYKEDNVVIIKSSHFTGISYDDRNKKTDETIYANGSNIGINTKKFTDLNDFKQWLSENKPIVYYLLAEPQIIDLPKSEPIKSLDGINNVDVLATLEPTYLEETYVYDYEKELNNSVNAQTMEVDYEENNN